MEGSCGDYQTSDDVSDLIDFSCSESFKGNIALPLIPCPKSLQLTTDSNPFDVVANQAATDSNDPFEIAFKTAFSTRSTKNEIKSINNNNLSSSMSPASENEESKRDCFNDLKSCPELSHPTSDFKLSNETENFSVKNQTAFTLSDPGRINCQIAFSTPCDKSDVLKCNHSENLNSDFCTPIRKTESKKNYDLNVPAVDNLENSISSLDFSNQEGLKASIRKRIKRVFNNTTGENPPPFSDRPYHNKTEPKSRHSLPVSLQENLLENTKNSSLSSIDLTSEETVRSSVNKRINKIKQRVLSNVDNSIQSQGVDELCDFNKAFLCSLSSAKSSVPESSLSSNINLDLSYNNVDDDVFVEAKKLSDTFSKISPQFSHMNVNDDDPEDLLALNPKWDPVDSSDEETDKLRNDPALNLKFSSSSLEQLPTPKKTIEFSDAVIQYSKRRSLNLNSSLSLECSTPSAPEVSQIKRSYSFNGTDTPKKEKEILYCKKAIPDPLIITDCLIKKQTGAVAVSQEEFSQKLKNKKPTAVVNKRGPLKAVIPLQKMTRPDVSKGLKKRDSPKERTGFNSRRGLQSGFSTPTKKNQKSYSHKPVASSTPNKNTSIGSSPASSPIPKLNKSSQRFHQSLDSAVNLQESQVQSSPLSVVLNGNKNEFGNKKFNSSGSELKKRNLRLSQLPRVKPKSVLNSQNGNRATQLPVPSRPLNGDIIDKIPSKVNHLSHRRTISNNKENILPV